MEPYINKKILDFCFNKGIIIENIIPRQPQMNGKAEKLNDTLLGCSRTMLCTAGLNEYMFGEAVLCATYLIAHP